MEKQTTKSSRDYSLMEKYQRRERYASLQKMKIHPRESTSENIMISRNMDMDCFFKN
jgi:hypothetical protein